MSLKLYNSIAQKKQHFVPLDKEHVKMYVCGPTVYDHIHIGNARSVIVFDVLYRVLSLLYSKVTYVRNITDVDDKIIHKSLQQNISSKDCSVYYTQEFHNDIAKLNVLAPTYEPKVTEHMPDIQSFISKLIEHNYAYVVNKHVIFSVESLSDYGVLSHIKRDELIHGARIEHIVGKKNFADFILWKPTEEKDNWASPWGDGRPGWHVECSALAYKYLGTNFDIHGGGRDLIFPHHENERAQSVCFCRALGCLDQFVSYWVHNGYVTVDGEKMSKSLGNFVTLNDVLRTFHSEVLRWALLSTHYRQPSFFSSDNLLKTNHLLNKIYNILLRFDHIETITHEIDLSEEFQAAIFDDLNTPKALMLLTRKLHSLDNINNDLQLKRLKAQILLEARFLGLLFVEPKVWLDPEFVTGLSLSFIENMISKRDIARKNNDFATADRIRNDLYDKGIILEDSKFGTIWRIK